MRLKDYNLKAMHNAQCTIEEDFLTFGKKIFYLIKASWKNVENYLSFIALLIFQIGHYYLN